MINHIIKTQSFSLEFMKDIFSQAKLFKYNKCVSNSLQGKIVAILFYEASTRTKLSFTSAILKLGGGVISTENASQFSSAAKGESLRDTIRNISAYCDCIVLRHKERGSAQEAAHFSTVPIINAGDGDGQHPTQSLLDLFTIKDELGSVDGITIILSGDLKHSRTIHSLAYLLGKFRSTTIIFAAPKGLEIPEDITDYLKRHDVEFHQTSSLIDAVENYKTNAVYHTRPQKERYETNDSVVSVEKYREQFTITRDLANKMDPDAIILHPLPRVDEIRYGVDDNHRAKYFVQSENGLYVRMALLNMLLGE